MPKEYIPSMDGSLTYIEKDTFLQRWEPRTKTITCIVSVFIISFMDSPKNVIYSFIGLLALVLIMGLKPVELIKKTSILLPFIIFMSIPILFGQGFPIDPARKKLVILLAFKSLTSLYIMFIMFFTQPMYELLGALSHLGIPDKVMSIIFLSWRYVFVLGNKLKDMFKALNSRHFEPRFNKTTFNTMGQIVGGMLIKSLDTSDYVYNAMVSRGFEDKIPVSKPRNIKIMDIVKSLIFIMILTYLLFRERW